MLIEATPALLKDELQPEMLRGLEILRHIPVPVLCQFDMNGNIMFQNPEATLNDDIADAVNSTRNAMLIPMKTKEMLPMKIGIVLGTF